MAGQPNVMRPIRSARELFAGHGALIALALSMAAVSTPSTAGDDYKCQDAAGRIEFRDRPCDPAHKSKKIDVTPNSIGTMTLEEVRAKNAELKARQQARQDADDKASAGAFSAQEQTGGDRGTNPAQPLYPATPSPPPKPPGHGPPSA